MKVNKIITVCFLIVLFICMFTNYAVLTTNEHEPNYEYFLNHIIIAIYTLSIVLDIVLFVFIIFSFFTNSSNLDKLNRTKKTIQILIFLLLTLIWAEIIYASAWHYGFGNHQNGLIANNWGVLGSIIFSCYSIICSNYNYTIRIILFFIVLILHSFLYLVLSPINILGL